MVCQWQRESVWLLNTTNELSFTLGSEDFQRARTTRRVRAWHASCTERKYANRARLKTHSNTPLWFKGSETYCRITQYTKLRNKARTKKNHINKLHPKANNYFQQVKNKPTKAEKLSSKKLLAIDRPQALNIETPSPSKVCNSAK